MGEPRKVFRIEEMARLPDRSADAPARHAELMAELNALRTLLAGGPPPSKSAVPQDTETARLTSELNRIAGTIGEAKDERAASMMRIAHELEAVVTSTEKATQKVLAAAEEIDQLANNLSAALKDNIEQGIAQDIRDLVLQVFEACNFQDLAGQRITKVMATLQVIESQVTSLIDQFNSTAIATRHNGAQSLHGPRLDGDRGHATQDDIDSMFSCENKTTA